MLNIYWSFLIFGIIFSLIILIFDDIMGHFLDGIFDLFNIDGLDFINSMVIVGFVTVFGAAGVMLTKYTFFAPTTIAIFSIFIALLASIAVYFLYVKPMKNSENSMAYSIQETIGKIGEVTVPVPATGFGEVLVKIGIFNTYHIATSFDQEDIQTGTKVVVIDLKDNALLVSRFDDI